MPVSDTVRREVWRNGQLAARLGHPVSLCPFAAQETPDERTLARIWVSGYLSAAPPSPTSVNFDTGTAVPDA